MTFVCKLLFKQAVVISEAVAIVKAMDITKAVTILFIKISEISITDADLCHTTITILLSKQDL